MNNEKLEFYTNLYNAVVKIEKLYNSYFCVDKIKADIIKAQFILSKDEKQIELVELTALESALASIMMALNKEKLEEANSHTENRTLFKYKDYKSAIKIVAADDSYNNGYNEIKRLSKLLNFNLEEKGPFPYMLEINSDNNKNRPYDYIAKIRNALLHAEYHIENNEILVIENHDDEKNLTFKGRLLLYPFTMFVKDFFCQQSVDSSFYFYQHLGHKNVTSDKKLIKFLRNFQCFETKFTKIPNSYTFIGQNALYSRLCKCFGLDSIQTKDIITELGLLEKEGFDFDIEEKRLNNNDIANIIALSHFRYKNIFKDDDVLKNIKSIVKLHFNPITEITNCLDNMLSYALVKKYSLIGPTSINALDELKYDEYSDVAFQYALTILKAYTINYAIECDCFEEINFNFDNSLITIENKKEFERRKANLLLGGLNNKQAENKIILETIRNSLAHGGNRLKVSFDSNINISLTDKYQNVPNLSISASLHTLNNVFNSLEFKPENIKVKNDKQLVKTK